MSEEALDTFDLDAQEARREAAVEQQKQAAVQLETDFINVMNTRAGRNVIWSLLGPMWRSSYTESRDDTYFREGERNVALRVWAQLQAACPTLAHKMLEENRK